MDVEGNDISRRIKSQGVQKYVYHVFVFRFDWGTISKTPLFDAYSCNLLLKLLTELIKGQISGSNDSDKLPVIIDGWLCVCPSPHTLYLPQISPSGQIVQLSHAPQFESSEVMHSHTDHMLMLGGNGVKLIRSPLCLKRTQGKKLDLCKRAEEVWGDNGSVIKLKLSP